MSYVSNPSQIFKTEVMEAVLWLVKRVYPFLTHPVQFRMINHLSGFAKVQIFPLFLVMTSWDAIAHISENFFLYSVRP